MPSSGKTFGQSQSLGEDNFYALYQITDSSDGAWFETAGILTASLHIDGLEADGSLKVFCSNNPNEPDEDHVGVEKQTIAGTAGDQVVAITAPYSLWKRISKVEGAAPTETTVYFAGVRRN